MSQSHPFGVLVGVSSRKLGRGHLFPPPHTHPGSWEMSSATGTPGVTLFPLLLPLSFFRFLCFSNLYTLRGG